MSTRFSNFLLPLTLLALTGCATTSEPPAGETETAASEAAPRQPAQVDAATLALFRNGTALLRQARYEQAAQVLAPAAQGNPRLPGLLVNLAIAYIQLDRKDEARPLLEQALAADPEHAAALNWAAILNRREGRFMEAKALYERLLAAHPEHRFGHLNLGILCDLYLHQPDCAMAHYQRYQALAGEPDAEVAHWIADLERRTPGGEQ